MAMTGVSEGAQHGSAAPRQYPCVVVDPGLDVSYGLDYRLGSVLRRTIPRRWPESAADLPHGAAESGPERAIRVMATYLREQIDDLGTAEAAPVAWEQEGDLVLRCAASRAEKHRHNDADLDIGGGDLAAGSCAAAHLIILAPSGRLVSRVSVARMSTTILPSSAQLSIALHKIFKLFFGAVSA